MIETGFKSVKSLDGRILNGWIVSSTTNGVLYYINHGHAITQWDHPNYISLLDDILQFNGIKYAAYRTALKFRLLQKTLKFDKVSLQCVTAAFDVAGLRSADSKELISIQKIERILLFILNATYKSSICDYSVVIELILNLLLNSFDENRSGQLEVLPCKIILIILSGGRLQEKYKYIFGQVANQNNYCSKKKLAQILHIISAIPEILSEQLSFGSSYVPATIVSCFNEIEQSDDGGVPEDHFLNWLLQEPQSLVWWSTAYRLSVSEKVCHDVKCSVCKQYPCTGLRYQCLRCLSYNLCQDCFLHGYTSKSHKVSHPIQEYCHESSTKEWRKSVMKLFRHRLKFSQQFKPRYLSLSHQSVGMHMSSLFQESKSSSSSKNTIEKARNFTNKNDQEIILQAICNSVEAIDQIDFLHNNVDKEMVIEPYGTPSSSSELICSVVTHLQDAHRFLCDRLENCSSTQENLPVVLKDHILKLQTQIQKLQSVLNIDYSSSILHSKRKAKLFKNDIPRMESTPIVGERGLHLSFSPICTELHNDSAVLDNKENHDVEKKCFYNILSSTKESTDLETTINKRVLSTTSKNQSDNNSWHDISVRPKVFKRFPSFSELSLIDLTSASSIASSGDPISNNNIYKEFQDELRRMKLIDPDDTMAENLKNDIDKQLIVFESMFPTTLQGKGQRKLLDEITTAANEVGDVMITYMETLPISQRITAF